MAQVKKNSFLLGLSLVLALSMLLLCALDIRADDDEYMRKLWLQGVNMFEDMRYGEAYEKFNEFLSRRPSSKLALEMRDVTGYALFVQMLSKDKDIAFVVKKVLELAEEQVKLDIADEDKIKAMLDKIKDDDYVKKYKVMEEIASTIGHYVVPHVVEILGNKREDELRVDIIILLSRLREDAVLPVIEILDAEDSFTRQNAATILGHIGDQRSIAALKKMVENPKEDDEVIRQAKISLLKITNQDSKSLLAAKEYYYRLAERYYYDDLDLIYSNYKDWVVWFWANEGLHYRVVKRFEYNEQLAEEACHDGLELDPTFDKLWTLFVCVYYAQYNEVKSALDVAEVLSARDEFPSDEKDVLDSLLRTLEKANVINFTTGKRRLYKALKRSMEERNILVSVSCINGLRDLGVTCSLLPPKSKPRGTEGVEPTAPKKRQEPKLGVSLVACLKYPDKRVRYAAAECIVKLDPKEPFLHHDMVIPTLIEALGEWKPRVILVIESNDIVRNHLKGVLEKLGYMPIFEKTGLRGLNRAMQFPTEDMIIVSTELPDLKAYEIIDALKHDPRTLHTPIVVTYPKSKRFSIEAIYADKCKATMHALEDTGNIRDIKIGPIFESMSTAQVDVSIRARRIAQRAAETLAIVNLENGNFRAQDALNALIEAVQGGRRHDDVRNPALQAIGHLGIHAEKAMQTLITIFSNRDNTPKIRVNTANAMGDIFRPDEDAFSENAYKTCKEALHEENMQIQIAASKVLGVMNLTPKQRLQIAKEQRIHKAVPE